MVLEQVDIQFNVGNQKIGRGIVPQIDCGG
jgi:hypothetical protein